MPPFTPSRHQDTDETRRAAVIRYHDGTKHGFNAYARSLGYLDWASQPRPFRDFGATSVFPLYPVPGAAGVGYRPGSTTFDDACGLAAAAADLSAASLGDGLRHALGLSAWKRIETSRWALRVNPSSGNLHPTEAYVVCGAMPGLADGPAVYHYAADRHALELRCRFDEAAWRAIAGTRRDRWFLALTSIHWREAWKYGERAFRYCQHDAGHAVGAVAVAAGMLGWRTQVEPAWSHDAIASATGIDRDADFVDAEAEEPACLLSIACGAERSVETDGAALTGLVDAIRGGAWSGQASQLSDAHVQWSFIDEVAQATRDGGRADPAPRRATGVDPGAVPSRAEGQAVRPLVLQRRSAVAFDGHSRISRATFLDLLSRVLPGAGMPCDSVWWTPRVHLALFVHRVDDVPPGIYLLARDPGIVARLRAACRAELLWTAADAALPLWCLHRGDVRSLAASLSCGQAIASDGCFSLGMIADFDASLEAYGPSFYRHLFWETGVVGQALYLAAEAAGVRATGIGCFFDDPVHDVLGLTGHAFQSLYHFTIGTPIGDTRLTTEPGYPWETVV